MDCCEYQAELQAFTGKLFNGDITPVLFELLCTTDYMDELLNFLREVKVNVHTERSNKTTDTESGNRLSVEDWFSKFDELKPV